MTNTIENRNTNAEAEKKFQELDILRIIGVKDTLGYDFDIKNGTGDISVEEGEFGTYKVSLDYSWFTFGLAGDESLDFTIHRKNAERAWLHSPEEIKAFLLKYLDHQGIVTESHTQLFHELIELTIKNLPNVEFDKQSWEVSYQWQKISIFSIIPQKVWNAQRIYTPNKRYTWNTGIRFARPKEISDTIQRTFNINNVRTDTIERLLAGSRINLKTFLWILPQNIEELELAKQDTQWKEAILYGGQHIINWQFTRPHEGNNRWIEEIQYRLRKIWLPVNRIDGYIWDQTIGAIEELKRKIES